jgi:hypothetical protein
MIIAKQHARRFLLKSYASLNNKVPKTKLINNSFKYIPTYMKLDNGISITQSDIFMVTENGFYLFHGLFVHIEYVYCLCMWYFFTSKIKVKNVFQL